ncbi:MAG: response regulator [Pyrinomonadaceae bacterium]
MNIPLRTLFVEDSENDAELLLRELQRGGYDVAFERVDTAAAMRAALAEKNWDIVISDFSMPQFNGLAALEVLQQSTLDLPFIIISGSIGEATAVAVMKAGAHDYLMKDNLARLVPAVQRELNEAVVRREKKQAEEERAGILAREQKARAEAEAAVFARDESLRALQASETRYHTLIDAIPQMMWTLAPDGKVSYLNQRWFEFTGRAPEENLKMGWLEAVHPDDYERLVETRTKHIKAGEGYEMEARFHRRDETYRWHLVRTLPLRNESSGNENSVLLWLGTATDIDDLKRAEEARAELLDIEQRARTEAEEANRAKDEFLATLSHEMRTPLTPIMGWVRMLRNGMLEGDAAAHGLMVIDKNANSLLRLINDLLDMSAILSGKMRIEQLPIDLTEVLIEAVETVRTQAEQRGISIEADLCDNNSGDAATRQDEPVMVAGDRTRLVQVFWNLLNNAVKFSPEQSRIKVTCRHSDTARVEIEDEGQGIAPDFLPHIFERFRQADSSNTRVYGGMGIGLALVKSFVEAHGGTVCGTSEGHARGSKFTVELPLFKTAEPDASSTSASVPVQEKPNMPARILVVDDAPDILDMLRATFESRGFQATLCRSAQEALQIARTAEFDVIISDIGLPEIDGYELIKQLRSVPHLRDTPALALTGYASQQDLARALSAGFNAHVAKPVDPSLLLAQIEHQLQSTDRR